MNTNIVWKQQHFGTYPKWIWRTFRYDLSKSADIAKYVARERYAWPGGYPLYAIADDGGALCSECCRTEFWQIAHAIPGNGWNLTGCDVNWEDHDLYCEHCSVQIESAY